MKERLVSIIINCHNGEKYLDKSLSSILSQTYRNWEIIFFDNKSSDKSLSIVKSVKDKRIKIFRSKKFLKLYKMVAIGKNQILKFFFFFYKKYIIFCQLRK